MISRVRETKCRRVGQEETLAAWQFFGDLWLVSVPSVLDKMQDALWLLLCALYLCLDLHIICTIQYQSC